MFVHFIQDILTCNAKCLEWSLNYWGSNFDFCSRPKPIMSSQKKRGAWHQDVAHAGARFDVVLQHSAHLYDKQVSWYVDWEWFSGLPNSGHPSKCFHQASNPFAFRWIFSTKDKQGQMNPCRREFLAHAKPNTGALLCSWQKRLVSNNEDQGSMPGRTSAASGGQCLL